ncbi:MAG: type II toxin-antitoxin system HicB family antitoxin [Dehalococcoidia bacterium]|nr:type II toxin-antitoxin system HicB family antitoxin [Dehalococcoidia bacterium]
MATVREYTAAVYEAEEGGYWAEVLEAPGCVAQGETLDELERNLREAIDAWEETRREIDGEEPPRPVHRLTILREVPEGAGSR